MSQSGGFPTTQWTSVQRAGEAGPAGSQALAQLLPHYLHPLRMHLVLQRRLPADKADDLLQAFVAEKVLERNLVGAVERAKGKFRTFLLVALDRFVSNQLRNEHRASRSLESGIDAERIIDAADDAPGPAEIFEIAWARQVLAEAARRMRQECEQEKRKDIWVVFEARVLAPSLDGAEPAPYEHLVEQLSLESVTSARNLTITGKRMFARSMRGVVREYIADEREIEQEIDELRAILSRAT